MLCLQLYKPYTARAQGVPLRGDPDPPPGPMPARAGSRTLLGFSAWCLCAVAVPLGCLTAPVDCLKFHISVVLLGLFPSCLFSFPLLVFLCSVRFFASFVVILVYWTPSCLFPWLLAFAWLYLSFVAVGRGSLFLCSRVGDRREFL